jgi:hypothetical protein
MTQRVLVALLLVGASAKAQSAFGSKGQIVPFGSVSYAHSSSGNTSSDFLLIQPGVVYFPTTALAVGLQPIYGFSSGAAGGSFHVLGFEPVVGFGVPLADHVAFFPRMGIGFAWVLPSGGGSSHQITMLGNAPLLYIPAPHVYIGFGPTVAVDLDRSGGTGTTFGLASEIGGYF